MGLNLIYYLLDGLRWTKTLKKRENRTSNEKSKRRGAKTEFKTERITRRNTGCRAKTYGFKTDLWTGKRVCKVIEKDFGVSYHFKHIPKLLRTLDFRLVKPKRQANEKNEEEKRERIKTTWEYIKKTLEWDNRNLSG